MKWLRDDPNGFRTDPQQVCTERAALEFLAELGLELAPQLVGSDNDVSLLVLEDLAPRVPLADLLRRGEAGLATRGLSAFSRALGELHAATAGHADTYYARRGALGPVDPQLERERFLGRGWNESRHLVEELGVSLSGPAEEEMARVMASLADPGAFLAFSNGDAGPNNFLVNGEDGRSEDGRIIDWEFAGYRHALTDIACLHVPGPMWITVSDPIAGGLEAEYRRTLAQAVPEASDDRLFGFGLAAACMAMAVERLQRFPKVDARPRGDESRVQLVSTLETAAKAAASHESLPHLTSWTREVAAVLRQRWPDADVDLSTYRSYFPRH